MGENEKELKMIINDLHIRISIERIKKIIDLYETGHGFSSISRTMRKLSDNQKQNVGSSEKTIKKIITTIYLYKEKQIEP